MYLLYIHTILPDRPDTTPYAAKPKEFGTTFAQSFERFFLCHIIIIIVHCMILYIESLIWGLFSYISKILLTKRQACQDIDKFITNFVE